MAFVFREDLGCSVYDPPLTGFDLKHNYFFIRDECAESLIYLQAIQIKNNSGRFGWVELVQVADTIGLPIITTCYFLEKWQKLRDGFCHENFEVRGLTSKRIRKAVDDYKNSQIC